MIPCEIHTIPATKEVIQASNHPPNGLGFDLPLGHDMSR
jgi:hypothetical protein